MGSKVISNKRIRLWAHIVSEHCNAIDMNWPLSEYVEYHNHEHFGPGGIRNHPVKSRKYSLKKLGQVLSELE